MISVSFHKKIYMHLRQTVDHRGRALWQAEVRSEAGKSLLDAFYA